MEPRIPLITFEGDDGVGKSTVIEKLKPWLNQYFQSVIYVREPGGTSIAEQIRHTILNPANVQMSDRTELLLYEAARSQLVDQVIRPAIQNGQMVICDRFIDSTIAYQGQPHKDFSLHQIQILNAFATHNLTPGLTIYLQLSAQQAQQRIHQSRNEKVDRLDEKALTYHQQVVHNYEQIAQNNARMVTINANQDLSVIVNDIKQVIRNQYESKG